LLFELIFHGIDLIHEIGKAISDNNDDGDSDGGMMMHTAQGTQA
tara:strand:- start:873 stop:1004 length:132 start_codon:yes stop_codon:yes gene_type:complete